MAGLRAKIAAWPVKGSKRLSRKGLETFIEREVSRLPRGAVVLSVGAGGAFEAQLRRLAQAGGLRLTTSDIDAAREPEVVDDITRSRLGTGSFDAIAILEVLEHVTDPHAAAAELRRLLRPGGVLLLSTPFTFPLHDRPYDFFRYTRYGLEMLFGAFEEVEVRERNTWPEAILTLASRIAGERGRGARITAFVVVPLALLLSPPAALLGRLTRSDFLTTGYVMRAVRPSAPPA